MTTMYRFSTPVSTVSLTTKLEKIPSIMAIFVPQKTKSWLLPPGYDVLTLY